ncbi:MAG: carbohydrate kinase family protein [Leadbetterella sp.]
MMANKKYALLSVGELLVDFIGAEISESLLDTHTFQRYHGGSPANLAQNMALLGHTTKLISCVGDDNFGKFLHGKISGTKIDVSSLKVHSSEPSSIVMVSRTKGTPDFIPYRGADKELLLEDFSEELLSQIAIFHTTCWPLSRNPSQTTLLEVSKKAKKLGAEISLDLNYAYKVWPDLQEAHQVVRDYLSLGGFIKLSEDDATRFFGDISENKVFEILQSWGATLICYTLGAKGSKIIQGSKTEFIPALPVEVKDSTGAGDAYWAGFLSAYLSNRSLKEMGEAGSKMASKKLQTIGPISEPITDLF